MARFISQLAAEGLFEESPGPGRDTAPIRLEAARALSEAGVLVLIDDGFGELTCKLRRQGVQWDITTMISLPTRPCRLKRAAPLLKYTKLELMAVLFFEGWQPADPPPETWAEGDDFLFDARLSRPLSYFACLVDRRRILAATHDPIVQAQSDAYYRCLMLLDQAKLQLMLQDAAGEDRSNE